MDYSKLYNAKLSRDIHSYQSDPYFAGEPSASGSVKLDYGSLKLDSLEQ